MSSRIKETVLFLSILILGGFAILTIADRSIQAQNITCQEGGC